MSGASVGSAGTDLSPLRRETNARDDPILEPRRPQAKTRKPVSTKLEAASGGSHARWLLSAENRAQVIQAVQPGGLLTRTFFESIDTERTGYLTATELDAGLRALTRRPDANERERERERPVSRNETRESRS